MLPATCPHCGSHDIQDVSMQEMLCLECNTLFERTEFVEAPA